jgi:cell division initiation protein
MSTRMTAMEIENQGFTRKLRGCDPGEVELYLKSVADEVGRLNLENGKMAEEVGRMRTDLKQLKKNEQNLQQTLVSAQRMSDEMKERAEHAGRLVVQEARVRAEGMLKEAQNRLARIDMDVHRSTLERETCERRLHGVLEQHLALLELRQQARGEVSNVHVLPQRAGGEAG